MVLRRFRRPREVLIHVVLEDVGRNDECSPEFVEDLCTRVMDPAVAELGRNFGPGWERGIAPSAWLEGPGLAFKITVVKVKDWEFGAMVARISQVFNEIWEREIDRVPPY